MANSQKTYGSDRRLIDTLAATSGVVALVLVLSLSWIATGESGETLTRNTVRLSLAWYAAALVTMLQLQPGDWPATTTRGRLARWFWTWAIVVFLVHLAVAFHFYHGWSHARAFERTREVSGTGEGIYVSYLFTLLWLGDAGWWWIRPVSYAVRSPWIDRALHAFMLFIVFNGMVIYESGVIRYAGILMFAMLAAAWFLARSQVRLRPA